MPTEHYKNGSLSFGFVTDPGYQDIFGIPLSDFKDRFGTELIAALKAWMVDLGREPDIRHWKDVNFDIEDHDGDGKHEPQEVADAILTLLNPDDPPEPRYTININEPGGDIRYVWFQGKRICQHSFPLRVHEGGQFKEWVLPTQNSPAQLRVHATLSWSTALLGSGAAPPME